MDPRQTLTETVTDALDGTADGPADVRVHNRHVEVAYTDGPDAGVVADALADHVQEGLVDSVTVTRSIPWTCGTPHTSEADAWFAHEGRELTYRNTDVTCDLGCGHGERVIAVTDVIAAVESGRGLVSDQCRPRRAAGSVQVARRGRTPAH